MKFSCQARESYCGYYACSFKVNEFGEDKYAMCLLDKGIVELQAKLNDGGYSAFAEGDIVKEKVDGYDVKFKGLTEAGCVVKDIIKAHKVGS